MGGHLRVNYVLCSVVVVKSMLSDVKLHVLCSAGNQCFEIIT